MAVTQYIPYLLVLVIVAIFSKPIATYMRKIYYAYIDLFAVRKIEYHLLDCSKGFHDIYKLSKDGELLDVYNKKNKFWQFKYTAVSHIIFDTRKHPVESLQRKQMIALFYSRSNEPFTRMFDNEEDYFVDQQKKQQVLKELGHFEDDKKKEVKDCSDLDFARADFGTALIHRAYNKYQHLVSGGILNTINLLFIVSCVISLAIFAIYFELFPELIDSITNFVRSFT